MRAARVPVEEQLRLINACRKSGMSDYQWCIQQGIKPSTFYNWLKRLRQSRCAGLDDIETSRPDVLSESKQEVVRIHPQPQVSIPDEIAAQASDFIPCMELTVGNVKVRLSNNADPVFLANTLKILKGISC